MPVFSTLAEAPRLSKVVVIIDVFRASNTIISLLARDAYRVVTVETIDEAREIKRCNEDWILLGERGGMQLPGCDGDNSPAGRLKSVVGNSVVLTSSGGTRCIAACGPDQTVIIGSFANAAALSNALRNMGANDVGFWAAGLAGERPAEEDILCAQFLEAIWLGKAQDFSSIHKKLLECDGARRLRKLGQDADLAFCVSLDSHSVVPRRVRFKEQHWCFENVHWNIG